MEGTECINEKNIYADVIIDISHEKVDRPFQYRIPDELKEKLSLGMSVLVPFGNGNTLRKAYVIGISDKPTYDVEKIKAIDSLCKKGEDVHEKLLELAAWMKETYGSTMITALKTVLPVKQKVQSVKKRTIKLMVSQDKAKELLADMQKKHQVARERLLTELIRERELPYEMLTGKLHISKPTIDYFVEKGLAIVESEDVYRIPLKAVDETDKEKNLSQNQQNIVDAVVSDFEKGIRKTYLIHGITGSGKTEVYLKCIEEVIKRGKQVIVLIPEIALTYQTVMRFYHRFGERVSFINSTLSQGEKYDQHLRAKKGEIDVIIGPRSALFTPFQNLGLIVIDEEHENTYKSENVPKYHAREVAAKLARLHNASVILGSATPSLEAYSRAKKGEYQLFTLKERLTGGFLPTVYTVDLREELRCGNRSVFSRSLQEKIADRLEKKEQIILFLNRRGYAGFVSCRACGYVVKCPHCDVSMAEHMGGKMVCHYCGFEREAVHLCPDCGSKYIQGFKAGTQQIESQIQKMFPTARVLRMDADTTRTKDSYDTILAAFSEQKADILLGTQMIVKGHDFPQVTLVGVLAADLSLHQGDYRAAERTFQLLTQAVGRAGRGQKEGEAVIQTYHPEHYSVIHAANQDYESFFEEELIYRELMDYPPAAHFMAVQVLARESEKGEKLIAKLCDLAKTHTKKVIGPTTGNVGKIKDIYRFVFYVKDKDYSVLTSIKDALEEYIDELHLKNEAVYFDFDPMNMF